VLARDEVRSILGEPRASTVWSGRSYTGAGFACSRRCGLGWRTSTSHAIRLWSGAGSYVARW